MTVPALDTSFIGTLAYIQPATAVQIADVLPYLHSYQQYSEYVDGVMRIYDTGGASGYYCDCYVRIRTDGWMMAFFPDDANQGSACWGSYGWTLSNYNNRGDLVWWGHVHSATGDPTADSTRLGRALSEMWTQLKANSNNPTYTFAYTDVGYYDYEHTNSTKIYIFGGHVQQVTTGGITEQTFYFTIPVGTTIQEIYANIGYYAYCSVYARHAYGKSILNEGTVKENIFFSVDATSGSTTHQSTGFETTDITTDTYTGGVQNTVYIYSRINTTTTGAKTYVNNAIVIFASG